jgi:hypothetical protein
VELGKRKIRIEGGAKRRRKEGRKERAFCLPV